MPYFQDFHEKPLSKQKTSIHLHGDGTFLSPHQKKKESPRKKPFSLYVSFHFSSFLVIFPFLHAQKCRIFIVWTCFNEENLWASKSVKQIDDAIFHLCDSPEGANHLLKSNWILISSLQGQMYDWSGVFHCIQQDDTQRVLGSFLNVYVVVDEILHRWHTCGFWQPTEDDNMPCSWTQVSHKKRTAICCRSSCKWLAQVRPFATVYFTFLAFHCCQMLSKKQPWQGPLTLDKKTRRLMNWPNIATKFARQGTNQSLLPSNWSSWRRAASATQWTEFESNPWSSTSPGQSCARLPAGLRPHRHLWCHTESTWSAQKGVWRFTAPREDGISKKVRLCHLSPNPPKTSPLCGVGPILV